MASGFGASACASASPETNLVKRPSSVDQSESIVGRGTLRVIQEPALSCPGAAASRSERSLTCATNPAW